MTEENSRRGRNNKARAKGYEREIARILGTSRYPADVGGKADLVPVAGYVVQVKSEATPMKGCIREGLDAARSVAGPGEIGVCVYVDRSGTRLRRYVVHDLQEWAAWHGLGGNCDE